VATSLYSFRLSSVAIRERLADSVRVILAIAAQMYVEGWQVGIRLAARPPFRRSFNFPALAQSAVMDALTYWSLVMGVRSVVASRWPAECPDPSPTGGHTVDRQPMAYLLSVLLIMFCVLVGAYLLRLRWVRRTDHALQGEAAQALRVRKAEDRIADSGGHPLSRQFATPVPAPVVPELHSSAPTPVYPEGRRRPGDTSGS
jgi:cation transport ATPase